jgi:hypothetical protein
VVTIGALTGVHGSPIDPTKSPPLDSSLARADTETKPIANPEIAAVHVARMVHPEAVDYYVVGLGRNRSVTV